MGFTTIKILGQLLMLLSIMMVPPIFVETLYQDGYPLTFHLSFAVTFGFGFLLWFFCRTYQQPLRTHDGFLIVVIFWLAASCVAALPLYLTMVPNLSFTNAFFEAVSGITTTGSTILTNLETLPHSILYYRQQLQFIGGISIIILAVAILPALGIGGLQLFRTEVAGPINDDKLTPRITHTAKGIWLIYVLMTMSCAIFFKLAGMNWFDALGHSFSTVSTGGFSTHDASIGFFTGSYVKITAMIFMFLGALSFNLHFMALKKHKLRLYFQDPELQYFVKLIFITILIIWVTLIVEHQQNKSSRQIIEILFQTISFATTTGFELGDLSLWPALIPMMLLFLGLIGGCAGSTSGGLKVIRVLLLQKQGLREIHKLIHPRGQYVIKLENKALSARVIEGIWGFFAIYIVVFTLLLLLLLVVEKDFYTAYSALIGAISNTGRGLGQVVDRYTGLSDYSKWILSFAMLAGRLEILTLLVLFTPAFWRR